MSNETIEVPVADLSNSYIQFSGGCWCKVGDNDIVKITLAEAAGNLKKALWELEQAQTRVDSLKYVLKKILTKDEVSYPEPGQSKQPKAK
jgi:hypothetical protein